jgi:hypothetical protein
VSDPYTAAPSAWEEPIPEKCPAVSKHYVTIPGDDFGWLAATLYARTQLRQFAALAVKILQAAGARQQGKAP